MKRKNRKFNMLCTTCFLNCCRLFSWHAHLATALCTTQANSNNLIDTHNEYRIYIHRNYNACYCKLRQNKEKSANAAVLPPSETQRSGRYSILVHMKRSRLISIETESDSNTFWSWYSTQEFPKHKLILSQHTHTHNTGLAAASLQQSV